MADGHIPYRDRLPNLAAYPLPQRTRAVTFDVHQRGDGRWQVSQRAHCVDRAGEKDTVTDHLSHWPTKAEADAALDMALKSGSLG